MTIAPPPGTIAPGAPARHRPPISGAEARRALAEKRSPRASALRLLAVLVLFGLAALGWRVTEVDFVKLVRGLPSAQHIVVGLLTPDVVTREVRSVNLSTPFKVGEGPQSPSEVVVDSGQSLRITPGSVHGGDQVTFEGRGFEPSSTGTLTLDFGLTRGRKISDVETDARGTFDLSFPWPASVAEGDYNVSLVMNAPTGGWLPSETFKLSLAKIGETVLLALMGTLFGITLSVPLSFLGARNLMQGSALGQVVYYLVRTLFNVGRSIEVLILAVIMAVVVGIGPFAGVMAIVLHSIGANGKLYSEAIESIDPGPIEAITATGASRLQTILYGVVPQVIPQFLAFTIYRWDIDVRMSTVIGLVGGGGIGFLLIQYINLLQWSQAATAIWLIAIVVMAMDYASAAIRARIV
jgi:phosphonate transport system permease protein